MDSFQVRNQIVERIKQQKRGDLENLIHNSSTEFDSGRATKQTPLIQFIILADVKVRMHKAGTLVFDEKVDEIARGIANEIFDKLPDSLGQVVEFPLK